MSTTTTSNYGWTIPNDSELVKDGAAAIRTLGNAADSSLKSVSDAALKATIIDAKGDLLVGTAADTIARLGVGTDGQVLTADSASTGGIKWNSAGGGMTLISETVASGLSSLSLSSIPQTYKQLVLVWSGIYHSASGSSFHMRLNNDSGANYYYKTRFMYGSTYYEIINGATSSIAGALAYSAPFGRETSLGAYYDQAAAGYLVIDNYASTSKYKTLRGSWSHYDNAQGSPVWADAETTYGSTSAITSLDVFRAAGSATFSNASNTSIRLYGVA